MLWREGAANGLVCRAFEAARWLSVLLAISLSRGLAVLTVWQTSFWGRRRLLSRLLGNGSPRRDSSDLLVAGEMVRHHHNSQK